MNFIRRALKLPSHPVPEQHGIPSSENNHEQSEATNYRISPVPERMHVERHAFSQGAQMNPRIGLPKKVLSLRLQLER